MKSIVPVFVALLLVVGSGASGAQELVAARAVPVTRVAAAAGGTIEGLIADDRGRPVAGAIVSALGAREFYARTDSAGRFVMVGVPPGPYRVRAHRSGYAPSQLVTVRVQVNERAAFSAHLRRATAGDGGPAVGTSGALLLAGAGTSADAPAERERAVPSTDSARPARAGDQPVTELASDDHSERVWRLRHLKRSVLKDATIGVGGLAEVRDQPWMPAMIVGRAFESSARFASSLFTEFPFSGEFNLLTSGSFDAPRQLFSGTGVPDGLAFLSINGRAGGGDWTINGAMTPGDVVSWFVSGSYASRRRGAHVYDLGLSYSAQRYDGGNPSALAAVGDGSRTVGAVSAYDDWRISPLVSLDYGGRYARHGYLEGPGLFSPRASLTLHAAERVRIRTVAAVRMLAPGAEEFLPVASNGLWVPPERTFAPLSADRGFRTEQTRHYELGVEYDLSSTVVLALRTFRQRVGHQLVALFGVRLPDRPRSDLGHYFTADAGGFDAYGWGVSLNRAVGAHVRGSVEYSLTDAVWSRGSGDQRIARSAPSALRADSERLHDVTTSLETDIPQTATRVAILYRVNSGFAQPLDTGDRPKVDGRFDVQVTQSLPFLDATGARWEMLVGVRSLFREAAPGARSAADVSVYDELLVVRPPKRIIGGVLVRF